MSVVFIMAPAALALAAVAIAAFMWAARDGQFDDVDTPPHRVLFDETPVAHETPIADETKGPSNTDPKK